VGTICMTSEMEVLHFSEMLVTICQLTTCKKI
jgi:hypothetical protein